MIQATESARPAWQINRLALTNGMQLGFKTLGLWTPNNKASMKDNEKQNFIENLQPSIPLNFGGKTIILSGGKLTQPFVEKTQVMSCYYDTKNATRCTGYVGELVNIIAASLNTSLANIKGGDCGAASSNKSRLNDVQRGAADLAVGTCVLTQERAQIAHSFEWFELQGTFISTAALKTLQQPFLIADIFKAEVWLLVLAVTAAATIAFLFIQTIMDEPRDIVEIPLRAILSQGYSPRTGYFATRLLELVTWAFTIPLVALYAGNLTASLSSPRFEAPVNSWSDLAARPDKIPVFFPNDPIHQLLVVWSPRHCDVAGAPDNVDVT
ncbi:probable glutamate receptor [Hyalella azteca]|uniref:Probable glutamate receptor n=1 Tax=Hyalella azteca TaxID=294128 RepID=A0A979FXA4_HYAAZ|nr:probable glutamate receptor [Hyalella azteca]